MRLQGQEVEVEDKVYDLLEGWGSVSSVDLSKITVKFAGNVYYSYNSAGKRIGNTPARFPKFLFWQDPIVMLPLKDDTKWQTMKEIFFNAHESIKRV